MQERMKTINAFLAFGDKIRDMFIELYLVILVRV